MQGNLPYSVAWSGKADEAAAGLGAQCSTLAELDDLMRVLSAIETRLRTDPMNFGELYRAKGNVQEHLAVQEAIAIDFAIDKKRRVVLVRTCQALSRRGV